MNKKKSTITVGIPAFNEGRNITNVLQSVLSQEGDSFLLEKVIVVSDGSTDDTEKKVRILAESYPVVSFIDDKKRTGKISRLNELYAINMSDFLITLDADVVFESTADIERMVKVFCEYPETLVVAAHEIPVKATTLVEKINNAGHRLWDETRLFVNGGNHIHNLRGSCSMIRKSFLGKLRLPIGIRTDAPSLYIMAIRENASGFRYAYHAHILFRSPDNLMECRLLGTRAIFGQKDKIQEYFGDSVKNHWRIPMRYKIRATLKMLLIDPIFTTLSILLGLYVRCFPLRDDLAKENMWKMVASTKKPITTRDIQYDLIRH